MPSVKSELAGVIATTQENGNLGRAKPMLPRVTLLSGAIAGTALHYQDQHAAAKSRRSKPASAAPAAQLPSQKRT